MNKILTLIAIACFIQNVYIIPTKASDFGVYFPNPVVKLSVPMGNFTKLLIGQFQVLAFANNTIAPDYIYGIHSLENNDLLSNNSTTGEVFMKNDYNQETLKKVYSFVLTAVPKNLQIINFPYVKIDIYPEAESEYCNDLEHMCFWKDSHYQLFEDIANNDAKFIPIKIGSLNALGTRNLCPDVEPKYTLETGGAYFELRNNFLYTNRKLDHEKINVTEMNALVTCTLNLPSSLNVVPKYQKLLNITLLDRNDNGPELQQANQSYNFQLEGPHFEEGETIGSEILFVDKDTMAVNTRNHTYQIINDSMDIVTETECNMYEIDHTGRRNTIISCQLIFARNGILSVSPYCFDLKTTDNTIEDGVNVPKSATAHICLHLNERFSNLTSSVEENDNFGRLLSPTVLKFPKKSFVYRQASSYSRVAQPSNFMDILHISRLQFAIAEDRSGAFSITSKGGVLYVREPTKLLHAAQSTYSLNLTWHDAVQHYHVIQVHLLPGRPDNVSCEIKLKSYSQTCAQMQHRLQCEKFCGLATNGGACTWRGSNDEIFGRNYASCVPDPQFCPDNICDPLEELNTFACPQDCTPSHRVMGLHLTNANKRGILSASGTCHCEDNGKCSCTQIDEDDEVSKIKIKEQWKHL